ncbi:B- and T-lymphocyte attenuator [Larimichthys crocea]|uniref:B- and T-lymphocyte attenuator n=1 Tax=Larimichthys crocea TaxID=215358 RepID=UPI00054B1FCA|nr:B- and T-lymphocyte attenuator [Larimichthys crocea]
MRLNRCLTVPHVFILMMLLLILEADGEDTDCEVEFRVRRNTVYETSLGEQLRINCTVIFCNNSPPTVSWYKLEKTGFPVDVSSDSHIKTEWKTLKAGEGISYLIFQNVLKSDSGVYLCHAGDSVSHCINVSVHEVSMFELTTATTSEPQSPTMQNNLSAYLPQCVPYHAAGVGVFILIVIIICVTSKRGCKGRSRDTPDPNPEPSSHQ